MNGASALSIHVNQDFWYIYVRVSYFSDMVDLYKIPNRVCTITMINNKMADGIILDTKSTVLEKLTVTHMRAWQ